MFGEYNDVLNTVLDEIDNYVTYDMTNNSTYVSKVW